MIKENSRKNCHKLEYTLQITSVGKRTVTRHFTITDSKRMADLGTLYTGDDTQMLKGVEVVAQKPLVKAEIDKISYSIEDDPDSKTNTTLEMLRKYRSFPSTEKIIYR